MNSSFPRLFKNALKVPILSSSFTAKDSTNPDNFGTVLILKMLLTYFCSYLLILLRFRGCACLRTYSNEQQIEVTFFANPVFFQFLRCFCEYQNGKALFTLAEILNHGRRGSRLAG